LYRYHEDTHTCDIIISIWFNNIMILTLSNIIVEHLYFLPQSKNISQPVISATSSVSSSLPKKCVYIGNIASHRMQRRLDQWCTTDCNRGYCSPAWCSCNRNPTNTKTCHAIGMFRKSSGMSDWCNYQCNYKQYCPQHMCRCDRRF